MKKYIYEIIFLLRGGYKKLLLMFIIFFVVAFFELIGVALIGPYIGLLIDPDITNSLPLFLSDMMKIMDGEMLITTKIGLLLIIIFFIKMILLIFINREHLKFSQAQQIKIRSELMKAYQAMSFVNYQRKNSSEYIYAMGQLTGVFSNTILLLLRLASEIIIALSIILFLAWRNPESLLLLLSLILAITATYYYKFNDKIQIHGEKSNIASVNLMKNVYENIEGVRDIRVLKANDFFYKRVCEDAKEIAKNYTISNFLMMIPKYLLEFSVILFVVLMVTLNVSSNGTHSSELVATLGVFGIAAMRLLPSSSSIVNSLLEIKNGRDSISRLYNDLKDLGIKNTIKIKGRDCTKKENIKLNFSSIEFLKVSFKYPDSNVKILNNASIKINKGDVVGIVGNSGSGKSTLVDILLGLLMPDSGDIRYNEKIVNNIEWGANVAYLPQKCFITDDSIINNIALGIDVNKINKQKVNNAIRKAKLQELIDGLEFGVNTMIGEGGARLSGGQRQRIALARAFYYQKKVLIMDESTSALDRKIEDEIMSEIMSYNSSYTVVLISHRIKNLKQCNKIYRLSRGRVTIETYSRISIEDCCEN
jgi:ATP-binding cassette, subfamily B, bacterial PglK